MLCRDLYRAICRFNEILSVCSRGIVCSGCYEFPTTPVVARRLSRKWFGRGILIVGLLSTLQYSEGMLIFCLARRLP